MTLLAGAFSGSNWRVIVVDSDESNACLHWMLGFEEAPRPLLELVGGKSNVQRQMRQSFSDGEEEDEMTVLARPSLTVDELPPEYRMDGDGRVLVTVGKIHQSLEGCACPMGVLSREFLKKLHLAEDEMLLVDMEAGIEHFGRGVETSIDAVVTVVEPSVESVTLAAKVKQLASEAGANFAGAIVNKVRSEKTGSRLNDKLQAQGVEVLGTVEYKEALFEASLEGNALPLAPGDLGDIPDKLMESITVPR